MRFLIRISNSDNKLEYSYGNRNKEELYQSVPLTPIVKSVLDHINNLCETKYNAVFLNRYNDKHNFLGWHQDDFEGMDQNHPIASYSLGAEREIWWKRGEHKGEVPKENRKLLEHGSVFIMPRGFQKEWYHRIPKCDKECGVRISLTFRKFIL